MNFMDILREAKGDKAEETPTETASEDEATDYTEEVNTEDTEDAEPAEDEATDYTEEVDTEETQEDETTEDTTEGETQEDEPPTEEEGTDYTEEVGDISPEGETDETTEETTDDGSTDDTSSEESEMDAENNESLSRLYADFIRLYDHITMTNTKLDKLKSLDMISSQTISKVKDNFSLMSEYIYRYLRTIFKSKTYVDNLYTYKYLVQLYKICVQMLSKINNFSNAT